MDSIDLIILNRLTYYSDITCLQLYLFFYPYTKIYSIQKCPPPKHVGLKPSL